MQGNLSKASLNTPFKERNDMKNLWIILIGLGLFTSCGQQESAAPEQELIERVDETFPDGKPKAISFLPSSGNEIVKQVTYHENGQIKTEGSFSNGKRDGEWKSFYEDGTPWSLNTYKEGILDGAYMAWHENGQVRIEGQYINGVETGIWKYFTADGILVKEIDQAAP